MLGDAQLDRAEVAVLVVEADVELHGVVGHVEVADVDLGELGVAAVGVQQVRRIEIVDAVDGDGLRHLGRERRRQGQGDHGQQGGADRGSGGAHGHPPHFTRVSVRVATRPP